MSTFKVIMQMGAYHHCTCTKKLYVILFFIIIGMSCDLCVFLQMITMVLKKCKRLKINVFFIFLLCGQE